MATYSDGMTVSCGDGASPEVFSALALIEVPEVLAGVKALYPNRTTGTSGNVKQYGVGREEGEEMALVTERDLADTAQDLLRTAYNAGTALNIRFVFADGTTTETNTASFLVTGMPVQPTDPNGDGETVRQTFNVKRNGAWTTAET